MAIVIIIAMLFVMFYMMSNKNRRKYKAWERSRKSTWNRSVKMFYR